MIFLFVIPAFAGLANFVLPIMIGAKDMAFPRLNALSIWMLIPGGLMMAVSPAFGAFSTGWTAYTPLATQGGTGQTLFEVGVQFAGAQLDHDRDQLPGHDLHHAGAGHDRLAHAAARLGERHDLGPGRVRHPVHRRLAVPDALRPRRWARTSSTRPAAAT